MQRRIAIAGAALMWVLHVPASAFAHDQAVVQIGHGDYAEPPPVVNDRPAALQEPPDDPVGSVLRLHLGPVAATTGRGLGPGLGAAADFGHGTLGFRLAAAWLRGEPGGIDASPIGGGLSQYTGELTLDFVKRGPLHHVLGLGFGWAHVDMGSAAGSGAGGMGIGTVRAGLEYALAFDDADIRFSGGVLGALPGPADSAVAGVKGWAILGAAIGIGF